jgi:molybdenum cofactor cytidylyltransferase
MAAAPWALPFHDQARIRVTTQPVVVVLAAGSGSRFGGAAGRSGHKLAQPFAATTVLGSTLAAVRQSGLPRVVVTTPALLGVVAPHVDECDIVLLAVDAATGLPLANGMGHSIAAGVMARAQAAGWLVLPADMPLVQAASLGAVAEALHEHTVAQAQYRGQRGHPVGFRAELYAELTALSGDEGARRLVQRHAGQGVEVGDGGVLLDLDTSDDLAALRELHAGHRAAIEEAVRRRR